MIDQFLQNFSWPTFWLALLVFVLVSNIINLITANFRLRKAKVDVIKMEREFNNLKAKLKNKQDELENILVKGSKK